MGPLPSSPSPAGLLRQALIERLKPTHPLAKLADVIDCPTIALRSARTSPAPEAGQCRRNGISPVC